MSEENAQPDPKELVQQILEAGKGSELLEMLKNALNEDDPAKQKVHPRGFEPLTFGSVVGLESQG